MAPPRNRRPGYSRRAQYSIFIGYLLAGLGAIVGLLLLGISIVDPRGFSALRTAGAEITAPVSRTIAEAVDSIGLAGDEVSAYFNAAAKNAQMKRELEAARPLLVKARALEQENARLKRLLQLSEKLPETVARGRIISSSASSTRRIATLGVGSAQGIENGQPVRAVSGLVGRILETGPTTARVLLASDTQNVIPVKRTSDGQPAFARGLGNGQVRIEAVSVGSNALRAGDLFVTSGNGGLYPPNIPVAKVIETTSQGGIAVLLANPAEVSYVLVQPIYQDELLKVDRAAAESAP